MRRKLRVSNLYQPIKHLKISNIQVVTLDQVCNQSKNINRLTTPHTMLIIPLYKHAPSIYIRQPHNLHKFWSQNAFNRRVCSRTFVQ